jgi:hypothetical protein
VWPRILKFDVSRLVLLGILQKNQNKKPIPVPEIRVLSASEQVGLERTPFSLPEHYIKFHLCTNFLKNFTILLRFPSPI